MAKYKYILTVIFILCTLITYAQPAQYTPMTASGYQMKRLKVDSTLHLPSFCGVPNLRGSTVKDGALAIDTCGGYLYMWTNQLGWDTINVTTTGGGGNQDLQSVLNNGNTSYNRDINLLGRSSGNQIYISPLDNNWMPFMALGDSIGGGLYQYTYPQATIEFINKNMPQKLKGQDSTRAIIYLPTQTIDATDTLAKLSDVRDATTTPTLQQVTDAGSTSTNTLSISGLVLGPLGSGLDIVGNTNQLAVRNGGTSDNLLEINYGATGSLKFGGGTYPYVEISNNPAGNVNLTVPSTGGTIPISVNGYTANSAGAITIPTIDTSNKFVNRITRTPGKDSIIFFIGGTRYAIKDSVGTGGSSNNGRFGNDTATIVMVKVHNDAGVTLTNGKVVALTTSGNNNEAPAVRLANNKGDSTSANTLGFVSGTIANQDTGWVILSGKIEKVNTSAFSNGDIIYLDSVNGNWTKTKPTAPYHMVYLGVVVKSNAGNGSIFVKAQNGYELDEIHDVKIISPVNNQVLAYSDTQRLWKNKNIYTIVDTSSLSNRINLKLNSADTASLSSRINLKLNISDTSVFDRKSLPAYSFAANKTPATANATAQTFRDTSGVFDGSITWTATTAPSGATNHSYRLTQIGKCVTLNISLVYATNGNSTSAILLTLPSNAPTPAQPTGLTGASQYIYVLNCQLATSANGLGTTAQTRGMMRNNSVNNGVELFASWAGQSIAQVNLTIQYWTN